MLSAEGLVVTMGHVVEHLAPSALKVDLPGKGRLPAQIVKIDAERDLALLKVAGAQTLPTLDIAVSTASIGSVVSALLIGPHGEHQIQTGKVLGLAQSDALPARHEALATLASEESAAFVRLRGWLATPQ